MNDAPAPVAPGLPGCSRAPEPKAAKRVPLHGTALARKTTRALLLALLLALLPSIAHAQAAQDPTPLQFHDRAEERRFRTLVAELRCVMCQNQSLADSNAQIAHDLRREVLTLMRRGLDDEQVRQHLVDRYGEFVLYRPRVGTSTWLLWFGPALLLLAGGLVITRLVRRRGGSTAVPEDDRQEW